MIIANSRFCPVGNYRKYWSLLAFIGCCGGLGCNSSTSSPGASVHTVTFPGASTQQWIKQSNVGTSSTGTAVNDFTTNIAVSPDDTITALGRAVPNPLPANNAPFIQEQEFLATYDTTGNNVSSTPNGQGVLAAIATVATGTPDGNYVAASNPATVGNSPTLLPLNVEKFSPAGATIWTGILPTTDQLTEFAPHTIVTDSAGDVYVAGSVTGPTLGLWGVFFAKFDGKSGNSIWQHEYTSVNEGRVLNIAADPDGSLYIAGVGNSKFTSQSTSNHQPCFLAKLDSATGNTLWSVPSPAGICYTGVAVNPQGNGYIVGAIGLKTPQIGYVAGFSAQSGTIRWQEQFGNGTLLPSNVSLDASGDAVFTGYIEDTGSGVPIAQQNAFVAKVGPDGQPMWLQKFAAGLGGSDSEAPPSPYIVTDSQSNIYVAGTTNAAFSGFQNPSGLGEVFVAKFAAQ